MRIHVESGRQTAVRRRTGGVRRRPGAVRRQCSAEASVTEHTILGTLRGMVESSVRERFPDYDKPIDVAECANTSLGDFQSSSAMQIFSALAKAGETSFRSPRDVADEIVAGISEREMFDSITIAGPGFINFRLSDNYIRSELFRETKSAELGPTIKRHVLVDFSSPNIAKEMHVGHLRSTIIGDTLCNVFEFCGYTTTRVNHVGDWGTQFGMLIQFMKENGISPDSSVSDLQACYKQAKQKFDVDDDFKAKSKDMVVKLQSYDPETAHMWRQICSASRAEFQTIYDRLKIRIVEKGESFYNDMIPSVLDELQSKRLIVEDAGALCIFTESDDTPVICRKSDGGFNYASTDLAAVRHRIMSEKADKIIYVTDQGQHKHFKAIFKTANEAGWGDAQVALEHVGFGVVLGEDGKRLRTRSGETVKLKSLLDEAEERCFKFLEEKGTNLTTDEIKHASKVLGVSSVKYADLQNNRLTNYTFSFDRMLDLKGNTAMYLQYSHARVATILQKSSFAGRPDQFSISHEEERLLAIQIIKFQDALLTTLQDLAPSKLCEYLYTLCSTFNNFYAECKVIGGDNEESRIYLCERTLSTMKLTFSLLGIEPLERL